METAGRSGGRLKEWKPLADQGHAYAQYNLGWMYANGEGVPEDDAEAVRWLRLAADQGLAEAARWLLVRGSPRRRAGTGWPPIRGWPSRSYSV